MTPDCIYLSTSRSVPVGSKSPLPALRPLAAVCLVFLCANGAASTASIFFSAFVNERGFSLATTGAISTAMMGGTALGSSVGMPLLIRSRDRLRQLVVSIMTLLIMVQLVSAAVSTPAAFITAALISGLGTGLVQAAGAAWIGRNPAPERAFALYLGTAYLSGVIGMPLFGYAASQHGLRGVFLAFASVLGLGLLVALGFPRTWDPARGAPTSTPDSGSLRHRSESLILLSIIVNFAVNGGLWVYLEEVGHHAHLSALQISSSLSAGMAAACLSTLTVASLGARAGQLLPLIVAHIALILGPTLMLHHPSLAWYVAGVLLFHVGFSAVTPFLLGMLASLDPSGRAPVRGIAATNVGYIFGPSLISLLVSYLGFEHAMVTCSALFTGCAALVVAARCRGTSHRSQA